MFKFYKSIKSELNDSLTRNILLQKEVDILKSQLMQSDDSIKRIQEWESLYGDFNINEDYSSLTIDNLNKESGWIRGEIVHAINIISGKIESLLLPGEHNELKKTYAEIVKIDITKIKTAGLHRDVDYFWNFENPAPNFGKFDLIVSQAMLEHLIDPFSHIKDLVNSVNSNGHLIIHTVVPGFPYHRYPIDCMRFYPDWFEEVANRLSLKIRFKYLGDKRIMYCFQKS